MDVSKQLQKCRCRECADCTIDELKERLTHLAEATRQWCDDTEAEMGHHPEWQWMKEQTIYAELELEKLNKRK